MILTCPECHSSFRLAEGILGEEGRKVKCSLCKAVWFQKPEEPQKAVPAQEAKAAPKQPVATPAPAQDEDDDIIDKLLGGLAEDLSDASEYEYDSDADDNPDFSKILAEQGNASRDEEVTFVPHPDAIPPHIAAARKKARLYGYGAACMILIVSMGVMLLMAGSMMARFPATYAFYRVFGYDYPLPGKDLIFDKVEVMKSHDTFKINGTIQNMGKSDQTVPMLEASLRDAGGDTLKTWRIMLSDDEVRAEAGMSFDTILHLDADAHVTDEEANNMLLRFVLADRGDTKTDARGDDNTHAPPQDEKTHQSDDAKAPESHPHASSGHH